MHSSSNPSRVRFSGPLVPYAVGLRQELVPQAADTSATERHPVQGRGGHLLLGADVARGGICGTDSVNCSRGQKVLRHSHFCLHHSRFGKSGPTFTSFGRVTTHPFDRVDTTLHSGQRPTYSGAVNTRTSRAPSEPMPTRSTSISVNPKSSELQMDMLAPLVPGCLRTPSSQGREPQISHRHGCRCSQPPRPPMRATNSEEPQDVGLQSVSPLAASDLVSHVRGLSLETPGLE